MSDLLPPARFCLPGLVALTALFSALAGPAGAREVTRRIRFAPGSSVAVVKGAVARGDRDIYLLRARAGETMNVRLTAVERNAALVILPPGRRAPLRGTEEGADATRWTGKLPSSGDYRLRVGSTRGNATYVLRVTVQRPAARGSQRAVTHLTGATTHWPRLAEAREVGRG